MKVIKVSGDSLDDLIHQAAEQIARMSDDDIVEKIRKQPIRSTNTTISNNRGEVTPDVSKIFWIDKHCEDDNVYTVFNVIAPFAIPESIKAIINKVNDEQFLTLRYQNGVFNDKHCVTCNFKVRKDVEYKYNFKDFKVDKKKLKITFKNGIISLYTVSTKITPKSDEFVIGL